MKPLALLFLLTSLQWCLGQADTRLIGTGDWSEAVSSDGHLMRGRLLVYDDQGETVMNHARLYLELQHVYKGGWDRPLEIYYDICMKNELHLELRDKDGNSVPQEPVAIRGAVPKPYWITLPCEATIRLRADLYTVGTLKKPEGFEILVSDGCWLIPRNTKQEFFLSGTFTVPGDHASPLKYDVWKGTLKLPPVKIPPLGSKE